MQSNEETEVKRGGLLRRSSTKAANGHQRHYDPVTGMEFGFSPPVDKGLQLAMENLPTPRFPGHTSCDPQMVTLLRLIKYAVRQEDCKAFSNMRPFPRDSSALVMQCVV
jgi:hypothetical protein